MLTRTEMRLPAESLYDCRASWTMIELVSQQIAKVGCCGFAIKQAEYYRLFPVVELQSTFYNLPRESTARRWKQHSPHDFAFCMKAWQVITHPATSPTWKRISGLQRPRDRNKYGSLRPTRRNFEAWEKTLEICKILDASVCVLQCPPSYGFSRKNVQNLRSFLGQVSPGATELAWEPRGTWKDHPDQVGRLCRRLDLIHVADVLRYEPAVETETCYFRLHGLGPREFNYSYKYTETDLMRLAEATLRILGRGAKRAFVMFNNINMLQNARSCQEIMLAA